MNITSTKNIVYLILLNINIHILTGFLPGTLVKTTATYQTIESLSSGDKVFSYNSHGEFVENEVKTTWKNKTDACVIIRYRNSELVANAEQQFYLPKSDAWVAAHQLQPGDMLLSYKHGHIQVNEVEKIKFQGFTHCIQFESIHNFCVSDDDIVTHNFALRIDLLNPPSLAMFGVALLVASGLWLVEYGLAQYGYHINFLINADGSLNFNPFKNNDVIDFDNPYAYYRSRNEPNCFGNHYQSNNFPLNNDTYNNDYVYNYCNFNAHNISYDSRPISQKSCPAVSITQLAPIKNSEIILQTTTPDLEICKKPSRCPHPIPQVPESTHSGDFEPIKQEKIIFTTPIPKIEKPHICIHDPIPHDLCRSFVTQEVASTELAQAEPKTIADIIGESVQGDKTKGKSKIYVKPDSTFDDAVKDFESLGPTNIRQISTGFAGDLSNGRTANVRTDSSDKRATLEVYNPVNKSSIKIRYGDKL